MQVKTLMTVIAVAGLVGGGMYAGFRWGTKSAGDAQSAETVGDETKVVHVHEHTTRVVRENVPAPAAAPAALPAARAASAFSAHQGPPPTQAQRSSFADGEFRRQTKNEWGREAETGLRSKIAELRSDGVRVTEVECRSSLCRVAVETPDEESAREYNDQVRRGAVWPGPGMVVRAQNGTEAAPGQPFLMTFFFAKPGEPLPTLN